MFPSVDILKELFNSAVFSSFNLVPHCELDAVPPRLAASAGVPLPDSVGSLLGSAGLRRVQITSLESFCGQS